MIKKPAYTRALKSLLDHAGKTNAKAETSSATGLGQFVNATWLDMIKRYRNELTCPKPTR